MTSAQPQRNIDAVRRVCLSSASVEARQNNRDFGPTLHDSTHNEFLQIMHPRTFHIKNPSDAKLALLSILRKWPVSNATVVRNRKIQNVQYLSSYSSYFHNISFWTYVIQQYRSNVVMTLRFQGQLIAKIIILRKINTFTLKVI